MNMIVVIREDGRGWSLYATPAPIKFLAGGEGEPPSSLEEALARDTGYRAAPMRHTPYGVVENQLRPFCSEVEAWEAIRRERRRAEEKIRLSLAQFERERQIKGAVALLRRVRDALR